MPASVLLTSFRRAYPRSLLAATVRAALVLFVAVAATLSAQNLPVSPFPKLSLPSSPDAYGRLEERACTSHTATGQAIISCGGGLGKYSGGKSCLWVTTYVGEKERTDLSYESCVLTCTDESLAPKPGAGCEAFDAEHRNQVIWRTVGGLSGEDREQLASLYGRLLPLINANSQEKTRLWLKQDILKIVADKMIPLRHDKATLAAGVSADPAHFEIVNLFEDPHPAEPLAPGLINPMGIQPDERLYVYESAFVEPTKSPTVHYVPRHPDQLAIDLVHEMIHMTQEGSGYASNRDFPSPQVIKARMLLFELQAYDVTAGMFQVRVMQQFGERVLNDKPATVQREFQEIWPQLDLSERRSLARWAYSRPDKWMKRKMFTAPTSDSGVWGELCTANPGHDSCGLK